MMDSEKELEKKIKHMHRLHDLASHCFLLSVLLLISFSLTSFILVIVCCVTFGDENPQKYDLSDMKNAQEKENATILICLTILSIVAVIVSLLLLLSTLGKNMWLTIPFWVFLVVLLIYFLFDLMYFGFCIGLCSDSELMPIFPVGHPSAFARNILGGGGSKIFSSMTAIALTIYAFCPVFGFFLECCIARAEEIKRHPPKPKPLKPPPPQYLHPPPVVPVPPPAPAPSPVTPEVVPS